MTWLSLSSACGHRFWAGFELHSWRKAFIARLWPEKSPSDFVIWAALLPHSAAQSRGLRRKPSFRETTCWYIAVATPTRLYQFVGGSTWTSTLKRGVCANDFAFLGYHPFDKWTSGFSPLHGVSRSAVSMVWRVEPGLYVGDFRFNLSVFSRPYITRWEANLS